MRCRIPSSVRLEKAKGSIPPRPSDDFYTLFHGDLIITEVNYQGVFWCKNKEHCEGAVRTLNQLNIRSIELKPEFENLNSDNPNEPGYYIRINPTDFESLKKKAMNKFIKELNN